MSTVLNQALNEIERLYFKGIKLHDAIEIIKVKYNLGVEFL
jgi:hypothetical protein